MIPIAVRQTAMALKSRIGVGFDRRILMPVRPQMQQSEIRITGYLFMVFLILS